MLMAPLFLMISAIFISGLVLSPLIVVAVSIAVWGRERDPQAVEEPHAWKPADAQTTP